MEDPARVKVIVVDDEPLGRERVRMFAETRHDLEVIGECPDGRSAVRLIREARPDLVLLDVQMPGLDGFGVIREVGVDRMPSVIFVTAYDRHAVRAFEVHALDYLLKPFRPERFFEAVDRATRIIREGKDETRPSLQGLMADRSKYLERILVKGSKKAYFVRFSEVEWVQAAGNYLCLHTGKKEHLIRHTMRKLERQLDPDRFVRIHRSALVNLAKVKELSRRANGEFDVVLESGKRLKLSRGYRHCFDRFDPLAGRFTRYNNED